MLVVPEQACRIISARKHRRCRPSRPRVPKKSPKCLWVGNGGLCWALRGIQRSGPTSPYVEEYLAQLCHLRISFWQGVKSIAHKFRIGFPWLLTRLEPAALNAMPYTPR